MKRLLFSAALMCSISMTGLAQDQLRGGGFQAPIVNDKSTVYRPLQSEIVFDGTDNAFYGYDGSTWINLGANATPAGSSTSGIVTYGPTAQHFGGPKIFDGSVSVTGALTPTGGIVGDTSGTAAGSGFIGEVVPPPSAFSDFSLPAGTPADVTGASLSLSPGTWRIYYSVSMDIATGNTSGNNTRGYVMIADGSGNVVGTSRRALIVKTVAAVVNEIMTSLSAEEIVNVTGPGSATYKLQAYLVNPSGTGSGTLMGSNNASYASTFHAVRIK